jgi:hypothetical protein
MAALSASPANASSSSRTAAAPLGSSCADPEVLSMGPGDARLSFDPGNHIELIDGPPLAYNGPASMEWSVPPGYVICSTRIQLANGSVVPPTDVFPYSTPTPTGGQYDETSDPASAVNTLTIAAAKSSVAPGTSCNYPQESSLIGTVSHAGPKSQVSVNLVKVSPTVIRLKLKPHKANLILCPKADIYLWLTNAQGIPTERLAYYVSVKPHGGLSSAITIPAGSYNPNYPQLLEAKAFARIVKPTPNAKAG